MSSDWLQRPISRLQRLSLDRKSTRLNSSHQIISYAVFCLKKKNTLHIAAETSWPGAVFYLLNQCQFNLQHVTKPDFRALERRVHRLTDAETCPRIGSSDIH